MEKEIMQAAKNALPAIQRMKNEFDELTDSNHPALQAIKNLEMLMSKYSIVQERHLFELVDSLSGEHIGVHIHDLSYVDEPHKSIYRIYTWEGYCIQIVFNKEYDAESSDGDEYDFYADWEGFKQGLTVEKAIEIINTLL